MSVSSIGSPTTDETDYLQDILDEKIIVDLQDDGQVDERLSKLDAEEISQFIEEAFVDLERLRSVKTESFLAAWNDQEKAEKLHLELMEKYHLHYEPRTRTTPQSLFALEDDGDDDSGDGDGKGFFAKIWEQIKKAWRWLVNLFKEDNNDPGGGDSAASDASDKLENASPNEIAEWIENLNKTNYRQALSLLSSTSDGIYKINDATTVYTRISGIEEALSKFIEEFKIEGKDQDLKKSLEHSCTSIVDTIKGLGKGDAFDIDTDKAPFNALKTVTNKATIIIGGLRYLAIITGIKETTHSEFQSFAFEFGKLDKPDEDTLTQIKTNEGGNIAAHVDDMEKFYEKYKTDPAPDKLAKNIEKYNDKIQKANGTEESKDDFDILKDTLTAVGKLAAQIQGHRKAYRNQVKKALDYIVAVQGKSSSKKEGEGETESPKNTEVSPVSQPAAEGGNATPKPTGKAGRGKKGKAG